MIGNLAPLLFVLALSPGMEPWDISEFMPKKRSVTFRQKQRRMRSYGFRR